MVDQAVCGEDVLSCWELSNIVHGLVQVLSASCLINTIEEEVDVAVLSVRQVLALHDQVVSGQSHLSCRRPRYLDCVPVSIIERHFRDDCELLCVCLDELVKGFFDEHIKKRYIPPTLVGGFFLFVCDKLDSFLREVVVPRELSNDCSLFSGLLGGLLCRLDHSSLSLIRNYNEAS